MTSTEIKELRATDLSTNAWLKELALQLAVMNEKGSVEVTQEAPAFSFATPKPGPVRPRKAS